MTLKRLFTALALVLVATASHAGPPARIADLSWMTGTWAAPVGPNTLEETWITAAGGGIAAMVRMSGPAGVAMWEVITIEEKSGTLMMTVQQWGSGFEPRTPQAQKLELLELSERRVKFKAVTEGSMASLGYSRSADNVFTIELGQPNGNLVKLDLKAR